MVPVAIAVGAVEEGVTLGPNLQSRGRFHDVLHNTEQIRVH
jgi:hypothetical protein